jgi:D-3-phosphoglycerate dehydrogenase / 2-oxoglutarate reductase
MIQMAQMKNGPARVLVADSMSDVAAQIMRDAGLDVDVNTGLSEDELVGIIKDYDALLVRSSTTVTPRILAAADNMKIVGRAGVGVDNVDIEAASRRGVIVMNTPLGNITSAAEHAWALLVALARNVAAADSALKSGRWDKKKFTGVELNGKTLGVIGMGKVGQIVARAAQGVGMKIVAYDPFLPEKRARELSVELADLDGVLGRADFLTIHTPLTDKTRNLLNADAIAKMKDGARLVNCARGGIVDEAALIKALEDGKLAGAAMDVFATEPMPEDDPLRNAPNIILTPHLGASTAEAQVKVAEAIAQQAVAFFVDGKIQNALNMGVALTPELEPFANLASRLGQILSQLVSAPPESVRCIVRGKLAEGDVGALTVSALQGLLMSWQDTTVNMVNAPLLAEERGLSITEEKSGDTAGYINLIRLVAVTDKGEHSVAGTVFEGREQRVVELEGYEMDIRPRGTILIMDYPDKPGMIGKFGTILGNAGINIASMDVGRKEKHGQACVALSLDDSVPEDVLATVLAATDGGSARLVEV